MNGDSTEGDYTQESEIKVPIRRFEYDPEISLLVTDECSLPVVLSSLIEHSKRESSGFLKFNTTQDLLKILEFKHRELMNGECVKLYLSHLGTTPGFPTILVVCDPSCTQYALGVIPLAKEYILKTGRGMLEQEMKQAVAENLSYDIPLEEED